MNTVECAVDRERHLTVIRCAGDVDGRTVSARILAFCRATPETIGTDCLVDVRDYVGNLGFYDIQAIATAWRDIAGERDADCRTAVVSSDRFAGLLVKVISLLFGARRFALFDDVEAAQHWLANR